MKKTSVMILAVLTVMVAGGVLFAHGEEDLEDVNMDFLPSPHYEYWHEYGFDMEDAFGVEWGSTKSIRQESEILCSICMVTR